MRVVGCAPVPKAPAADSITSSGSVPSPGGSPGERTRSRPAISQERPKRRRRSSGSSGTSSRSQRSAWPAAAASSSACGGSASGCS